MEALHSALTKAILSPKIKVSPLSMVVGVQWGAKTRWLWLPGVEGMGTSTCAPGAPGAPKSLSPWVFPGWTEPF